MSGKPIKPSEVSKLKRGSTPPEVFDAFNEMITENWDGDSASFTQKDVVARIVAMVPKVGGGEHVSVSTIYDRHWLDVEGDYRKAGWVVDYDRVSRQPRQGAANRRMPRYEAYEANFTFSKRSR